MNYQIKKDSEESAYIQLYHQLREDIVSGAYQYGDRLPSKRIIAEETQVSVITVQHAYILLCDEGYAESRERSGYFVAYKESDFFERPSEKVMVVPKQSHMELKTGDFSYNILSKTMRKVLLDYGERILVKSPNQGCKELRKEIVEYLARNRGIHVREEQIIIGSGAEYLYTMIAQLFSEYQEIAIENPCYEKIAQVYEASGHRVDRLTMGADGILTSQLEKTRAKILHVTPFHSYPSKITADISKKKEYIKWAADGKYIIEDNYDSELTVSRKMEDALFSLADGKRVIYINTFSKTIAPSIRVGYMILPQEMIPLFQEKLGFYSCTVPVFEQFVLAELLGSGDFERHINRIRRKLRRME